MAYSCPPPVEVQDVMDLEKTYWGLKGSGKFDMETFEQHICPPVPKELCEGKDCMYVRRRHQACPPTSGCGIYM